MAEADQHLVDLLLLSDAQRTERVAAQNALDEARQILLSASADALAIHEKTRMLIGDAAPNPPSVESGEETELQDEDIEAAEDELGEQMTALLPPPSVLEAELSAWMGGTLYAIGQLNTVSVSHAIDWRNSHAFVGQLQREVESAVARSESTKQELDECQAQLELLEHDELVSENALVGQRTAITRAMLALTGADGDWATIRESALALFERLGLGRADVEILADPASIGSKEREPLDIRAADAINLVASVFDAIEENAIHVRDAWGTARAFLDRETRKLSPRLGSSAAEGIELEGPSRADPILTAWVEDEIGAILSTEALRRELFNESEAVEFDLEGRAALWRTKDGKRRRRPLEAFSSGEQVFAYTRAKLETFKPLRSEAENVLIFLDEFGAFVARDRFGELMRYVENEVLVAIADQIVVMLPATSEDPASTTDPSQIAFVGEGYVVSHVQSREASL